MRIQRDQTLAPKSLQGTSGHARAHRQFFLRQVHGKTPGLELPCNTFLYLSYRLELNSQYIDYLASGQGILTACHHFQHTVKLSIWSQHWDTVHS
jgi:hypothetical protein